MCVPCTNLWCVGLCLSVPGSVSSVAAACCPSLYRAAVQGRFKHSVNSEFLVLDLKYAHISQTTEGKLLTFFNRLIVCCLTPGDWLLRLGGRKWRMRSISCKVRTSVLRWLSHTKPKASILTYVTQNRRRNKNTINNEFRRFVNRAVLT